MTTTTLTQTQVGVTAPHAPLSGIGVEWSTPGR